MALTTVVLAAALSGCGSTTTEISTQTVTVTRTTAVATAPAAVARASARPATRYKRCDANIRARKKTTTCGFAENAFYAYYRSAGSSTLDVWSPAVQRTFHTRCARTGATVTCRTADRGVVKFPQAAVDAYDDDQATAFAAAHDNWRYDADSVGARVDRRGTRRRLGL
jgi:hypothetical protein